MEHPKKNDRGKMNQGRFVMASNKGIVTSLHYYYGVWQEILKIFDHRMWRNKQWEVYLILYVSLTEPVQRYFREQTLLKLKKSEKEQRQTQEDTKNTLYADADYQSIFIIWDLKINVRHRTTWIFKLWRLQLHNEQNQIRIVYRKGLRISEHSTYNLEKWEER